MVITKLVDQCTRRSPGDCKLCPHKDHCFPVPQPVWLHTDHEALTTAPLKCPSKGHAAWLAKMIIRHDLDIASAETGDQLDPADLEGLDALQKRLEIVSLGTRMEHWGVYRGFWISADGVEADDGLLDEEPADDPMGQHHGRNE